jgi:hypothetical protein
VDDLDEVVILERVVVEEVEQKCGSAHDEHEQERPGALDEGSADLLSAEVEMVDSPVGQQPVSLPCGASSSSDDRH